MIQNISKLELSTVLYTLACGYIVYLLVKLLVPSSKRRALKLIDGPFGFPFIGHGLAIYSKAWLDCLCAWSEKYDRLYKLKIFGKHYIVLSDPEAVHQLCNLPESAAIKCPTFYKSIAELFSGGNAVSSPTLLTAVGGQQWHALRRSLLHSFSAEELDQDVEALKGKSLLLLRTMLGAEGSGVRGQVFDAADAAMRLSFDAVGLAKFGYDFEAVESKGPTMTLQLLDELQQEHVRRIRQPLRRLMTLFSDTALRGQHTCRIFADLIDLLWREVRGRGVPPEEDCTPAAQLIRIESNPAAREACRLTEGRVPAEAGALVLLGGAPPGHALTWALHHVAEDQAVQRRLMQEMEQHGFSQEPGELSLESLRRMPYLDAVVREVLRLHPPHAFPLTARHLRKPLWLRLGGNAASPSSSTMAGEGRVVSLPAGVTVLVDAYSMHRSPALWSKPDKFKPQRWLAGEPDEAKPERQDEEVGDQTRGTSGKKKGDNKEGVSAPEGADGNNYNYDAASASAPPAQQSDKEKKKEKGKEDGKEGYDGLATIERVGGIAGLATLPGMGRCSSLVGATGENDGEMRKLEGKGQEEEGADDAAKDEDLSEPLEKPHADAEAVEVDAVQLPSKKKEAGEEAEEEVAEKADQEASNKASSSAASASASTAKKELLTAQATTPSQPLPPLCSPRAFMPFGAGARCCVGQQFALVVVKVPLLFLTLFLQTESLPQVDEDEEGEGEGEGWNGQLKGERMEGSAGVVPSSGAQYSWFASTLRRAGLCPAAEAVAAAVGMAGPVLGGAAGARRRRGLDRDEVSSMFLEHAKKSHILFNSRE